MDAEVSSSARSLSAPCTSSADTQTVRCKSLQWQRSRGGRREGGRVEDTGSSPASLSACEHTAEQQRTITGATKGRMVHPERHPATK